jgi:type I restriction enzyme, S subunit
MSLRSSTEKWEVPESWVWTEMGKIGTVVGGSTPRTDETQNYEDGDIPWITPADLSGYTEKLISKGSRNITAHGLANSGARMLPAGTVLFSSRAPIGYVAIAANPLSTNQGFKSFVLPDGISSDYAYYYLQRAKELARELASGTTFLEISGAKAALIPIPIAPRLEQDRIVAEIEKQFTRLDDAVKALKRVQANLKRYRASVLKAACEGRLVPTEAELARKEGRDYEPASELLKRILAERRAKWEADQLQKMIAAARPPKNDEWKKKYVEPVKPDLSTLPKLSDGWMWVSLDQVADIQGGIQKQPKRQPVNHFYPYLRVANVYRGRLDLSEIEQMELFGDELSKLRLQKNDLLIVEGNGSASEIGRMAIWRDEIPDCVHQNHIIRARVASGVNAEFCAAHWNSPQGSSEVLQVASSTSGLYTLSTAKVARFCLPFPPNTEQQRIVEELHSRLSKIDACASVVQQEIRRASTLRNAVLRDAFSGKLVSQDPNDEPAFVLLERIRAERAALVAKNENQLGKTQAGTANGQRRGRGEKLAPGVTPGRPSKMKSSAVGATQK